MTEHELVPIDGGGDQIPKAPGGLKREGRKLWRDIQTAYDFADCPEKTVLLERACRTADVVARLQALVDEAQDLRVKGSQGQPAAIPEIGELRQYSALLASLLKSLTLPDEDDAGIAGGLSRSQIGRLGAQARWSRRG